MTSSHLKLEMIYLHVFFINKGFYKSKVAGNYLSKAHYKYFALFGFSEISVQNVIVYESYSHKLE
jgi:hypothetical protein